MKNYLWLLLALTVQLICILLGRAIHLPESVRFSFGIAPAMLVLFPFLKQWMPKVTFKHWLLAIAVAASIAWLIYFVLG